MDYTNQWLTETCLNCGSVNHIFLGYEETHAWECWNCLDVWWIDDISKIDLITAYDLSYDEADNMLVNYHPFITYAYGQMERSS